MKPIEFRGKETMSYNKTEQPTAEGAEAFVKSKGLNLDYVKGIQLFLNPKYTVIDLMTEFAAQPQPTAEGAEEILEGQLEILREAGFKIPLKHGTIYNRIIDAMQEHTTLHAQRIADKMVEEKWINVKDGLPEENGKSSIYCLVNSKYDGIVVRPYNEYHKCWDAEDADDYYCDAIDGKITHWMPLPNPPIK